jgi:hypothetical protein
MKPDKDPLNGPIGALIKFLGAAAFGGFVSLLLFVCALGLDGEFLLERPWIHVFWIIPLVWGVLGIFWLDPMLEAARHLIEGILGVDT